MTDSRGYIGAAVDQTPNRAYTIEGNAAQAITFTLDDVSLGSAA